MFKQATFGSNLACRPDNVKHQIADALDNIDSVLISLNSSHRMIG
jgi:hypothetical protein